jgi:hypothetical protein
VEEVDLKEAAAMLVLVAALSRLVVRLTAQLAVVHWVSVEEEGRLEVAVEQVILEVLVALLQATLVLVVVAGPASFVVSKRWKNFTQCLAEFLPEFLLMRKDT